MRFDYARNSYRDELLDYPSRSYSCALSHTFSHDVSFLSCT
jgi:hypothetical protein